MGEDGAVGLMLIPVSAAAFTVRLAVGEVMPLNDAVMDVPPTPAPVATPAVLIVAIELLPDDQVT